MMIHPSVHPSVHPFIHHRAIWLLCIVASCSCIHPLSGRLSRSHRHKVNRPPEASAGPNCVGLAVAAG